MVDSGVKVSAECLDKYNAAKKSTSDISFITYAIAGKFIEPDRIVMKAEIEELYAEAKAAGFPITPEEPKDFACLRYVLLKGDRPPRYATCLFKHDDHGMTRETVTFITWCPDSAPVKQRMLVSSTKESFKKKIEGLKLIIAASDEDDISYKEMLSKVVK